MQLRLNISITKKSALIMGAALAVSAFATLVYIKTSHANPLPASLRQQINFAVLSPSKPAQVKENTYKYSDAQKTLDFRINYHGTDIVFSEQPVPNDLGSDTSDYYPTLGIHPYAQFKTKAGVVALTKFWQSGSLEPVGQAAVMVSNGTLLIAHAPNSLTNQQWKTLFEGLHISR